LIASSTVSENNRTRRSTN